MRFKQFWTPFPNPRELEKILRDKIKELQKELCDLGGQVHYSTEPRSTK